MANIFNSIFQKKVGSSNFDMSYDHKFSGNMGKLIPFHVQEVLPGDKFDLGVSAMVRFAPIMAPIMHKVDVYCHFFFVPNRILWPNWEKFITGGDSGVAAPAHPFLVKNASVRRSTLSDYLGIPSYTGEGTFEVNALPVAAYQRIWYDYYRDQNLQESDPPVCVDGNNNAVFQGKWNNIRSRSWQHDYFTSALPFAQKGSPVEIPLGDYAEVYRNQHLDQDRTDWASSNTSGPNTTSAVDRDIDPDKDNGILFASLEEATSASVTDLRNAWKLQEWLEKNARGGTRYVENLLVHFGVRSSDRRLDRAEYLGGARQPLVVSEVLQTSSTDAVSPQANMAGHGISVGAGQVKRFFGEEHGFIFGIMSVMPSTAYFQGLPRFFSRKDRLDYYWPAFQHIGEQAILNKELYIDHSDPDGIFGYVPRYAEYKYMPSRVSGDFEDTLLYWHLARKFDNDPALNSDFIECKPAMRIFNVMDEDVDHLYCHVFNSIKVSRRMAKYSNPGL